MDGDPFPERSAEGHPLEAYDGRRAITRAIGPFAWFNRPVEVTFHAVWRDGGPAVKVETVRLSGSTAGSTSSQVVTLLTRDRVARARRRLEAGRWFLDGVPVELLWCADDQPPAKRRGAVSFDQFGAGFGAKRTAIALVIAPPAGCLGAAAAASDSGEAWWPWLLLAPATVLPGLLVWWLAMRRYGGSLWK